MNPPDADGLAARLAIEPRHLEIVRDVLSRLVPDREVWAFGSRAGGGAHPPKPWSDLDLAVIGPAPLSLDEQAALAEAFSESDLPWRVDVVDGATVSAAFRDQWIAARLLLQRGQEPRGGSPA